MQFEGISDEAWHEYHSKSPEEKEKADIDHIVGRAKSFIERFFGISEPPAPGERPKEPVTQMEYLTLRRIAQELIADIPQYEGRRELSDMEDELILRFFNDFYHQSIREVGQVAGQDEAITRKHFQNLRQKYLDGLAPNN